MNGNCNGVDVNDSECEVGWFDRNRKSESITEGNSIDRFIFIFQEVVYSYFVARSFFLLSCSTSEVVRLGVLVLIALLLDSLDRLIQSIHSSISSFIERPQLSIQVPSMNFCFDTPRWLLHLIT